jgi:ATP-dependent protease ClpP protease subunit
MLSVATLTFGQDIKKELPTDKIIRNMEVKNPDAALSVLSFLHENTGYVKLYSGLSAYDTSNLWNDLLVFEKVYKVKSVEIYLNSGGGGAFDGLALANEIERFARKTPITIYATGIVASAAVPVFAAASKRVVSADTIFMVHHAGSFKFFEVSTEKSVEAERSMFKLLRMKYIAFLEKHSKLNSSEWNLKLDSTTWFDAEQAFKWGLVDEIR